MPPTAVPSQQLVLVLVLVLALVPPPEPQQPGRGSEHALVTTARHGRMRAAHTLPVPPLASLPPPPLPPPHSKPPPKRWQASY